MGSLVWGTPANSNGFHVLASLLQRRRSAEANQTLHDVWPSPGLVHYMYIFGGSRPVTEFCQVQNSLRLSFALSYICSVTALEYSGCQQYLLHMVVFVHLVLHEIAVFRTELLRAYLKCTYQRISVRVRTN